MNWDDPEVKKLFREFNDSALRAYRRFLDEENSSTTIPWWQRIPRAPKEDEETKKDEEKGTK